MAGNKVTRCICHGRTFKEVQAFARKHQIHSVEELQQHDFCSNGCGLCIPYIKEVLTSGQLSFFPGEPFQKDSVS
ncbi:(2Fe-2S)-binding protein [Fodinibius salsisoli]|uniref:(2Fe-2S)-binding protein n=1 Tax=Fodinibius salsisoli TaxID=2820877 RepID=A0ABT3PIT9_9BACT|nr:(2Fe-2S)-binding protein [Fodinibius salsisoli]MCW9705837.1 (2Fe-2S)-binding protein [Fodinibius salsisoli]